MLDNCEHLLDSAAALAQAILHGASKVALLATSQEPLHLPPEQQYRVMPLALPTEAAASGARDFGAVALFVARVRAVDPRFALTDDSLAVAVASRVQRRVGRHWQPSLGRHYFVHRCQVSRFLSSRPRT